MIEDRAVEPEQQNVWRAHLDKVFKNIVSQIHRHLVAKVCDENTNMIIELQLFHNFES